MAKAGSQSPVNGAGGLGGGEPGAQVWRPGRQKRRTRVPGLKTWATEKENEGSSPEDLGYRKGEPGFQA